ncbi:Ribosomal_protein L7Ae/L30e/S12e/Gadd45 [Hexamita inflata]|uniref:Ribosomal protein L7Ae/L30e/S12e/Gadd45 n=1 Tax=Hexamita inflata TaxID=28002 RepID=A0AA86PHH1_9EUKA|nr:Ribosomal protein L7Ae/L30e/S12e/Gadd45 [Hexamita inflata]
MNIAPIAPQIKEIVKRHFECEHNARLAHDAKNQKRETKFQKRSACGFNEVLSSLKTKNSKFVVITTDVDQQVQQKITEIQQLAAEQKVPFVQLFTREELGQLQADSRRIPDHKHGNAQVSCLSILQDQPVLRELKLLQEYLEKGFTSEPFTVDFSVKTAQKQQRKLINPFNPKDFAKRFRMKVGVESKIKWALKDETVFRTDLIPAGTQKTGDFQVIGRIEKGTAMFVNGIVEGEFTCEIENGVVRVSVGKCNDAHLIKVMQFIYEIVPNLREIRSTHEGFKEIGFTLENGEYVVQCGAALDDEIVFAE